ncbi:cysteine proteinase [Didymella exigua CBS 183.55]|uniref:Cysteine proteinase n=1 Tax=Didymella exigua CBS 183.55 TaxID=1150837 RepID=A0A6A5RSA3_9PLEO|nr:cysteine proteinase [Didymella exigua CBS 183.55]KAF1931331.1 cysteine proteinase [Didymella exigua CBS 183.55]
MSSDVTAPASDTPSPLEALQQRHRKETRDLVSRITQKKKQASKKTRKGVNDECERLEQDLRERQSEEVRVLNGDGEEHVLESEPEDEKDDVVHIEIEGLSINGTAAPSSTGSSTSAPTATASDASAPGKKKNRQKERLARRKAEQDAAVARAEEEARNAPNPRELEKARFEPVLEEKGLRLHEIRADGHCLYAAVADQLSARSVSLEPRVPLSLTTAERDNAPPYKMARCAAADWIEGHRDDFEPFMEDALPEHVRKIRETGEWGGHLELLALAKSYGVRICVLHSDGRVDKIEDEGEKEGREEIWLGYYRHSHGLGEHYNSLRKVEA